MDKKELLKRWALAYTEPSLFYVPCRKPNTMCNILFHHHAPMKNRDSATYYYTGENTDSIVYASPIFAIYDSQGNYYTKDGEKVKGDIYILNHNNIHLPKGNYYYKEMRSLIGCKLNYDVIPFSVKEENTTIDIYHNINMIKFEYHIEVFDQIYQEVTDSYVHRWANDRVSYDDSGMFETIKGFDVEYLGKNHYIHKWAYKRPIVKIDNVSLGGKKYPISIEIDTEVTRRDSDSYLSASKYNYYTEYYDPYITGKFDGKEEHSDIYEKYSYNILKYIYRFNGKNYDFEKSYADFLSSLTKQISYYDIDWTFKDLSYWVHDQYQVAETKGKKGIISAEVNVGNKYAMCVNVKSTPYEKVTIYRLDTEKSRINHHITTTDIMSEKEIQPTETIISNYYENFYEVSMFKEIISVMAKAENITVLSPILYKEKEGKMNCYTAYLSRIDYYKYDEIRTLVYGNNIENKDADDIYIGALIQYESRDE